MRIVHARCSNSSSSLSCSSDVYIDSSLFEYFQGCDSSSCVLLEKKFSTEVKRSYFYHIINSLEGMGNAAAIYTSESAQSVVFDKVCFIDCNAHHGHSFGCFGDMAASINLTAVRTGICYDRGHPSYIVKDGIVLSEGSNLSNSAKETVYLRSNQLCSISHYFISNTSAGEIYKNAIFAEQLRANSVVIRQVKGIEAAVRVFDGSTMESMFVEDIGSALLCKGKMRVTRLFFNNFEADSKLGEATVGERVATSIKEFPYVFDLSGCWSATGVGTKGNQMKVAKVITAGFVYSKASLLQQT